MGGIRRLIVPIIDILCLGKHSLLKPSQKHTVPKSKDNGPPSGRRVCTCCVCMLRLKYCAFPVSLHTGVCIQLPCREINGLKAERESRGVWEGGGEQQPGRNVELIAVLQFGSYLGMKKEKENLVSVSVWATDMLRGTISVLHSREPVIWTKTHISFGGAELVWG